MVYLTTWMVVFLNGIHVYKPSVPWKNRQKKRLKVGKDHLPSIPFVLGRALLVSGRINEITPPFLGEINECKCRVNLRDFPYNQALFGLASFFGTPENDPWRPCLKSLKGELLEETWKKSISSCWNRSKRMKLIALGFLSRLQVYGTYFFGLWVVSSRGAKKCVYLYACMFLLCSHD